MTLTAKSSSLAIVRQWIGAASKLSGAKNRSGNDTYLKCRQLTRIRFTSCETLEYYEAIFRDEWKHEMTGIK